MDDPDLMPLTVTLMETFFSSSRDALHRASRAQLHTVPETTGLTVYACRQDETRASLESIVFSFLTIEATINYIFFTELHTRRLTDLDRWLRNKWKGRLSIFDRFMLLVTHYATATLNDFPSLTALLGEFIIFRNRIVHAYPDQYLALVTPGDEDDMVIVHDVQRVHNRDRLSTSGLTNEIGRIRHDDACRSFEIMLLVLSFLDEQFVFKIELPWQSDTMEHSVPQRMTPRRILEALEHRYYLNVDPASFTPTWLAEIKAQQTAGEATSETTPGSASEASQP